jgi:hypothetical protein
MGRTTLTRTTPLGPYPTLQPAADALDLILTAADTTNNNQILLDGPVIVVAHNTGVAARTLTITSSADAQNRTGDISAYSIGAGEYACFKIDQTTGWKQTDGYLYLQANNAEVKIGAIRLG